MGIINESGRKVKMIGCVAEFNPFTEGHAEFVKKARLAAGCEDGVFAAVMSGDFVQRGEPAIFDKFSRAAKAVRNGIDLVVELPLPWSLSSAERFASGGVSILERLGAEAIVFGSECGDIGTLTELKDRIASREGIEAVKNYLKVNPNTSYPAARSAVMQSPLLDGPNNSLGIEYLKAATLPCFTVKRENSEHDGFHSAGEMRAEMKSLGLGVDYAALELAIVSRLRMFDREYFNSLPDSADGAGNRLYEAVRAENTLEGIYEAAKTKSLTMSAVRRLTMCAALGIKKGMNEGAPPYIRILAFNTKGREALKNCKSPYLITQPKESASLGEDAQKVFAVGALAHDLYLLGFRQKSAKNCGEDYRTGPFIV